jgi:ABC transporter substrate binding protein
MAARRTRAAARHGAADRRADGACRERPRRTGGHRCFPAGTPDVTDQYSKAAEYIDRILKAAKPANFRVQAPTKFQLVINLKTAKALGLDVPVHLQQLANEIIE